MRENTRAPRLSLALLGGFDLGVPGDGAIRLPARKTRALLACLALRAGEPWSRDRLVALLWEDSTEDLGRASLRQALTVLRRELPESARAALRADGESVTLDAGLAAVDVAAFRAAVAEGTRAALERAVALYRGELLEGFDARSDAFDDWIRGERTALHQLAGDALERLCAVATDAGDDEAALQALLRWTALHPAVERARRALMQLHVRRGRPGEALEEYRRLTQALRRDLGVGPEPATMALHQEILRQRQASETAARAHPTPSAALSSAPPEEPEPDRVLREATVLAVRFAGLAEQQASLDPEPAARVALTLQARVASAVSPFGGVTDRLVGTLMMVAFSGPTPRGNEGERAIRAALALAEASAQLTSETGVTGMGLGLGQGQVLCAPGGGEGFPLAGRPLSEAAALAARAGDGEILISAELGRSLGDRLIGAPEGGPIAGAGIKVRGLRSAGPWPGAGPFVGRTPELGLMLSLLERAVASRSGRALLVRGEPGMGKTRLCQALRDQAIARGARVFEAQALDFGQTAGRRLVSTLTLALLEASGADREAARAAAVARVLENTPAATEAEAIFLHELVDLPVSEALRPLQLALAPEARVRGHAATIARLITRAAEAAPLLLLIEDVHWAAADELALLAEVAAAVGRCPALLVLSTRPERDPLDASWRARARGCPITSLDLGPLADDEARALAEHHGQLAPELVELCVHRAEGLPLFLDQLLRAASAGQTTLPGSIRALVLARTARLSPRERDVLYAAATLGPRAPLPALRFLIERPDADPGSDGELDLGPLHAAGLSRREGDELVFAHALFQGAIYQSLLRTIRHDLHRRAAQWFATRDPVVRAEHLASAADPGAAAAFLTAARSERIAYRAERALACARRARALAALPTVVHEASCLLGELELQAGHTHEALAAFREALDFATDPRRLGAAQLGVAGALRVLDRYDEALEALAEAEPRLDDPGLLARLWSLRGNLYFPRHEVQACLEAHTRARDFATRAGSIAGQLSAGGGLGDAHYQRGLMLTADRAFAACVTESRRHEQLELLLAYLPMWALTRSYDGALDEALAHCHEAVALARRLGQLRAELMAHMALGAVSLLRGEHVQTLAAGQHGLDLARRLGARRFEAEAPGLIGVALLHLGRNDEAVTTLRAGAAFAREVSPLYCGASLLGALALASPDPAERIAAVDEGCALLAQGGVGHNVLEFHAHAIEASLQDRRWPTVRSLADTLEERIRHEPAAWPSLIIQRARALQAAAEAPGDPAARPRLQALHAEIAARGFRDLQPLIEQALAGAKGAPGAA